MEFSHLYSTWVGKTNLIQLAITGTYIMITLTLKLFEKDTGFPLIVIKPHWPLKQNMQVADKMSIISFAEI
jgi:hypothetical protein